MLACTEKAPADSQRRKGEEDANRRMGEGPQVEASRPGVSMVRGDPARSVPIVQLQSERASLPKLLPLTHLPGPSSVLVGVIPKGLGEHGATLH